jgi:hypothetical protein
MLSNTRKLYFPKLIFRNSPVVIKSKSISLYSLDWTRKQSHCAKISPELTPEYTTQLESFRFAITNAYLKEINRLSWAAPAEWTQIRLIDDSMQLIYLSPAAEYVRTAVTLLADCLYNQDTEFWASDGDKEFACHLMLYEFWKNQVGKNMVISFVLSRIKLIGLGNTQMTDLYKHIYQYTGEGIVNGNKR